MNQLGQGVDVSRLQLRNFAKFDDLPWQRMLRREFLQNVRCGRARFCFSSSRVRLQIQLVKKNFGELQRRIDIEFHSRHFPDFFFQAPDLFVHRLRHFSQLFWFDANSQAFHSGEHRRERQIDFFVNFFKLLLFHLLMQRRRQPLEIISSFPRATPQHDVELAHDHIVEIVVPGRGPQQVRIKLRGMLDVVRFPREQGKNFWIVDDFRPLRVFKQRRKGLQYFAFFIGPDRAPLSCFWGNFNSHDARPQSFRFALAQIEVQPHRKRLFRRQLCQVFAKFRGVCKLSGISFLPCRRNGRRGSRRGASSELL